MTTAVDTNALLAILYEDDHTDESEAELRRAYRAGRVVVTPIVYAELVADGHFETEPDLSRFFADFSIVVEEPSPEALFSAGEAFARYAHRRPTGHQCPACGDRQVVECDACGTDRAPRQHVVADFLIGGHAATEADALVSFDEAIYATYFPELIVNPGTASDDG